MLRARRFRAEPFGCLRGELLFPLAVSLLKPVDFYGIRVQGATLGMLKTSWHCRRLPRTQSYRAGWHPLALAF